MENNLILRRLRYALDLKESDMQHIWSLDGLEIDLPSITNYLKKEDESGYEECPPKVLTHFLDGLIIEKRGPQKDSPQKKPQLSHLSNNMILKKLRIALNMREEEMLATFEKAGSSLSKSELTALFRKKDHKHFRACGDQLIRRFLLGLTK
jgi:uncharacterized protein YehS (DUF1456 family)